MQDVRGRVLAVAAQTFAEHGWRDSTVDAVCHRAGVTSREFYADFETVDDLFVEMYRTEAATRVEATRAALEPLPGRHGELDVATALGALAAAIGNAANDKQWWIITTEYMLRAVRHPQVAQGYRDLRRSTHEALVEVVTDGLVAAGIEGVDVDQFVELTTSLHRGAVAQSFVDPDATSPEILDLIVWTAVLRQDSRAS
ncbi:MAG: TetR/AcrR family transcriptional regulator [Aeromicrobium sp.]